MKTALKLREHFLAALAVGGMWVGACGGIDDGGGSGGAAGVGGTTASGGTGGTLLGSDGAPAAGGAGGTGSFDCNDCTRQWVECWVTDQVPTLNYTPVPGQCPPARFVDGTRSLVCPLVDYVGEAAPSRDECCYPARTGVRCDSG